MERANALFGAGIVIGIAEHLVFVFRYITGLNKITSGIKGVTIASGLKMPYFWELEAHTYYGYLIGVLMVLFLQAYWNWEYYNKKTKERVRDEAAAGQKGSIRGPSGQLLPCRRVSS